MVAGWGVGHITHPFRVSPRFSPRRVSVTKLEPPRRMDRAEWIATFELGSTVILITEKDYASQPLCERDQSVRFGEPLFDTESDSPAVRSRCMRMRCQLNIKIVSVQTSPDSANTVHVAAVQRIHSIARTGLARKRWIVQFLESTNRRVFERIDLSPPDKSIFLRLS